MATMTILPKENQYRELLGLRLVSRVLELEWCVILQICVLKLWSIRFSLALKQKSSMMSFLKCKTWL